MRFRNYICGVNLYKNKENMGKTSKEKRERLLRIRKSLLRGDIMRIAARAGVSRVWVSYVLHGKDTSEPVLRSAEALISERKQNIV